MEKLTQRNSKLAAMTLIEVLVALAVISFVFTALIQMTFNALRRAKILELQDKMRTYATEAVQVIYTAKDTDWEAAFGESGVLPPDSSTAVAYLQYPDVNEPPILTTLSTSLCNFQVQTKTFNTECVVTTGNEIGIEAKNRRVFGRIIRRIDINSAPEEKINHARLEVLVACIDTRCESSTFLPFSLILDVYRTSAPR